MNQDTTVLVLGASGMLGNAVLRLFAQSPGFNVVGTVRTSDARNLLPQALHPRILVGVNVEDTDNLLRLFSNVRPHVVINCIGLVKQLAAADDPLAAIPINSLLPHRLVRLCGISGARLVHMSTDCVFAGTRGLYRESDVPDAKDLYGRSKLLGEVHEQAGITLRTSIIGTELNSAHGLIGWFLAQRVRVKGFRRVVFSGVPTVELARVIRDFVLPRPGLHGLYHVSSAPINKYELLGLVAREYGVSIAIEPDDQLVIDRSLDSARFRELTGYAPPAWPDLVRAMREFG